MIRKNKKRIDPRYFLNETTHRDLDEGLDETDPQAIADLAQSLSQSEVIQDALNQLQSDPELVARAKNALSDEMSEALDLGDAAATSAAFGTGSFLALASAVSQGGGSFATQVLPFLAASPATAALGFGSGIGLMALAVLFAAQLQGK